MLEFKEMIKAAIFDLDDTLYDFAGPHKLALGRVAEYAHCEFGTPAEKFLELHKWALRKQFAAGPQNACMHDRYVRMLMICEKLGQPIRHATAMGDLYWQTLVGNAKPFEGTAETLSALRGNGIRIGVCTNMTAYWQLRKLEKLGIVELVDFVVASGETNFEKPDPRIFKFACDKAACELGECLFVGDNAEIDCDGALAVGMHALWMCPDKEKRLERPDLTPISSIPEVLDYIR